MSRVLPQELDESTLRTDEVYMDVYIGEGTNTTVRCDFREETTSLITVEAHHTPYNVPVLNRCEVILLLQLVIWYSPQI